MDVQDLQIEQHALHKRLGQMHEQVDQVDQWGRKIAGLSQAFANAARANLPPESHARLVKRFHKASQLLAFGVHSILWLTQIIRCLARCLSVMCKLPMTGQQ